MTSHNQQRENERLTRLSKRLIFTDGLKNPYAFQDCEEGVYAIIGPLAGFIADQDFQDELTELCRKYNLKHGFLSERKYADLKRC